MTPRAPTQILVRYTVKPDRAAENEAAVRAVFDALVATSPDALRYATFKLADGVTFVHLAHIDTPDGSNPLQALEAFQRFSGAVRDRCEEPPVVTPIVAVGSYRMFEQPFS